MGIGLQRQSKHLRWAGFHYIFDFCLVWISFFLGVWIRFGVLSFEKLADYGPGIFVASVVLPSIFYIGGLYSARVQASGWLVHFRWLFIGFLSVVVATLAMGSVDFSSRVGRGVILGSMCILTVLVTLRHAMTLRRKKSRYKNYLCLVTNRREEELAMQLANSWGGSAKVYGIVSALGYKGQSDLPDVGSIENILEEKDDLKPDVILVRDRHFSDPVIASFLRSLRYDGVDVLPLSDACEDAYHAVPLEIITDAWLFRSSNQSQLFYIRKLKRLSDIFLSLFFLVILSPFLAIGAMLVKIASPGPVIFRQRRAGRFGRPFVVLKLRTMHLENESGEEKWANDEAERIFPIGKILRTFRVDEIPQLINVLKGEMSFVGPRPEQPTIVEKLDREIPFYRDRLMIQPGITGWAQVCYPYGASVEDAARKLEYDLYYMKHMGIFLDFFILLETVKIILTGGVRSGGDRDYLKFREHMDAIRDDKESPNGAKA